MMSERDSSLIRRRRRRRRRRHHIVGKTEKNEHSAMDIMLCMDLLLIRMPCIMRVAPYSECGATLSHSPVAGVAGAHIDTLKLKYTN